MLIAYSVVVSGDPGPTPGDKTAWTSSNSLQTAWLDDIAKVVTDLGSVCGHLPAGRRLRASLLAARPPLGGALGAGRRAWR